MKTFLILVSLFILALSTACKKAVPELSSLKSLSGFSLDQNSVMVSGRTLLAFAVSGQCSEKYSAVQVSLDQGATWKSIKNYDSSAVINCQSGGNFSASFSINSSEIPTSLAELSDYTLRFRGESEFGFSDSYSFLLSFGAKPQRGQIVAGSMGGIVASSGGSFKLAGRIHAMTSGQKLLSSGNSYKLTGVLTNE